MKILVVKDYEEMSKVAAEEFEKIIKEDLILDVPKDTRMILTNAVYFKGRWLRPFRPEHTVPEPFHVTEAESRDVPMMKEDREYLYAEAEGVKLLKLSYGGSASMLLAMPQQGAMDELLKDLGYAVLPNYSLHKGDWHLLRL